ncbi:KXD1 [Bugula neritina]|uniref:KXD1 n=1 Tax=Bugula neritina TaxID=10212 RepID=A0A7J7J6F7_BUGNE|nr:KXD1 [Bugula neritina]KAF6021819.1 KXD1 [Bugula neritina]
MANNEKVEFGECKEQPSEANNKQPAADVISGYLKDLINSRDLQEVIETQNFILSRFEKTNETLSRVSALCEVRYEAINSDFRKHIVMLQEMKQGLDSVFKRIRLLRQTIKTRYPEAYQACEVSWTPPDDDVEQDQSVT